jgi:protease PrsW
VLTEMPYPSRARLQRLTRDVPLLTRWGVGIALGGFLVAALMVRLVEPTPSELLAQFLQRAGGSGAIEEYEQLLESLQNVDALAAADPTLPVSSLVEIAGWLHGFADHVTGLEDSMRLGEALDHVLLAVQRTTLSEPEKQMLVAYVTARLSSEESQATVAKEALLALTKQQPPPQLVHELMGYLHLTQDDLPNALAAFEREGRRADAVRARDMVWQVALMLEDKEVLQDLWDREPYREQLAPTDREVVGSLTGNLWLQWTGILHRQWQTASMYAVVVALFAALLWYVLLVRAGGRSRWRWLWPLLPVLAGVASIWPTLLLLNYQTYVLGMVETDQFPQDLYFNIMGTGLREEAAKLLLFMPFLPWLLKRRSAGLAVLTGGLVGLGFSLEENVDYISRGSDAWGRLLTANFLHIALTGMAGHALYVMFKTRFNAAMQFAMVFVMAVVMHGFYNWAPDAASRLEYGQDLDLISIILLAVLASQYYELLAETLEPYHAPISVVSIFVIGSGLLVAAGFISSALAFDSMQALSSFGTSALGLIPIAVFHVRKLGQW